MASNNSEALKHALHTAMTKYLGVVNVMCTHVHTRFGSNYFILCHIKKNWVAIDKWVTGEDMKKELFKPNPAANAADIYDAVMSCDIDFWESIDIDLELIDLIMKSMHTSKEDKPYLSQMHYLSYRLPHDTCRRVQHNAPRLLLGRTCDESQTETGRIQTWKCN